MSDYIKKNTFFSKLGVILSAGLLLLGLNHSVAQEISCDKFKEKFPQYDMSKKGKDCDDGRGKFTSTYTDVINKVHLKTKAPYAFLHSCLNPDSNSQVSILKCESKCTLRCRLALEKGEKSENLTYEASQKLFKEYNDCQKKCG